MGLLYHRECLKTEKKRELFDKYAITEIAQHVQPDVHHKTCRAIVKFLPTDEVVGLATLVVSVNLMIARRIRLANLRRISWKSYHTWLIGMKPVSGGPTIKSS